MIIVPVRNDDALDRMRHINAKRFKIIQRDWILSLLVYERIDDHPIAVP